MAQLQQRLGDEGHNRSQVRSSAYLANYIDNLAVRFVDAGDAGRAEALLEKAIAAGPRVARFSVQLRHVPLGD